MKPSLVVAGWTAANIVLALIGFAFGERPMFIGYYLISTVPLLLIALVVSRLQRRRGEAQDHFRVGQRNGMLLPLAFGILLIGLGLIFARWVSMAATVFILVPTAMALLRRPATVRPAPDDEALPHPVGATPPPDDEQPPSEPPRKHSALEKLAGAVGVAAVAVSRRRGHSQREGR